MGKGFTSAAAALLIILLATSNLQPQSKYPPDETLSVPSITLTNEQFLRGDTAGVPVTLSGQLRFPSWDERVSVVVLLHGSGGIRGQSARDWSAFLNKIGIATFRLDSFSARGLTVLSADQSKLGIYAQVIDAYRAVEVVAKHERIDPTRIAVMGFSRGGVGALYASMQRFHEAYGPADASIAAYLPFYPSCGTRLSRELDVVSAPIREFHGSADDWAPAGPCRDYFDRLRAAGKDAVMTEYPGALHSFDNSSEKTPAVIDGAQMLGNCRRYEEDGALVNEDTGKPFTYADACVGYGPTVGYDKAATEAAHTAVQQFLTGLFRLN